MATHSCSCLENPRDGGAQWAAVYGVAQSRTRLKHLSSSSSLTFYAIHYTLSAISYMCACTYACMTTMICPSSGKSQLFFTMISTHISLPTGSYFLTPRQTGAVCPHPSHASTSALITMIVTYLTFLSPPTDSGFLEDKDCDSFTGVVPEPSGVNLIYARHSIKGH